MSGQSYHRCHAERPHEYTRDRVGHVFMNARAEIWCEGDGQKWFFVVWQPDTALEGQQVIMRVQIHHCPWCGVRLLMAGERLADRAGEPGSFEQNRAEIEADAERTQQMLKEPEVRAVLDAFVAKASTYIGVLHAARKRGDGT